MAKYQVVQCSEAVCVISFLYVGAQMAGRLIDGEPYCTDCYNARVKGQGKTVRILI